MAGPLTVQPAEPAIGPGPSARPSADAIRTVVAQSRPVRPKRQLASRLRHDGLKFCLMVGDSVVVLLSFGLVLLLLTKRDRPYELVDIAKPFALAAIAVWALRFQCLWVSRYNAVRAIEISRLTRAIAIAGAGALLADRFLKLHIHVEELVAACTVAWFSLVAWRSVYRAWLAAQRRDGRFGQRVIIVGTDRRAVELTELFATHPEAGMHVVGLVGSQTEAEAAGLGALWLGGYHDADEVLGRTPSEGLIVCSTDVNPALLNALIREERPRRRHVYLDPGLTGIDFRRLQALPIAHQPLLYVDGPSLARIQVTYKRIFDVAVSALVALLAAPVLGLIALGMKLGGGGPILFKQRRVGLNGVEFNMFKFRSMVVDAEVRLASLTSENERTGPLFKLEVDPRVTRIGRFLRATSLDELPQLFNVLRGDMSLVGPRPALPSEVAEFPVELQARHQVRPGITGLWQVEARDNPSFEAYRRLDLFYVENYSLALDLVILLGTIDQMVLRPLLKRRRPADADAVDVSVSHSAVA